MLGVSLLAMPDAFMKGGWILSFALLLLFCWICNVSAKILVQYQTFYFNKTGKPLLTYGDIAEAAFGRKGRIFIQLMFTLELFAATGMNHLIYSRFVPCKRGGYRKVSYS